METNLEKEKFIMQNITLDHLIVRNLSYLSTFFPGFCFVILELEAHIWVLVQQVPFLLFSI